MYSKSMKETWKPIPRFGGDYEASDLGNIRSLKRKQPKILSAYYQQGKPYLVVTLSYQGKYRPWGVHRLVLEAFVGPAPEGMEACHDNGKGDDNRLSNLRWDTHKENCHDQHKHGTHRNTVKTRCKRGHSLSGENLYTRPDGKRNCMECRRQHMRKFYATKGATR